MGGYSFCGGILWGNIVFVSDLSKNGMHTMEKINYQYNIQGQIISNGNAEQKSVNNN